MINSDIFIMIPVSGSSKLIDNSKGTPLTKKYNEILTATAKYECDDAFVDTIQRHEVGEVAIGYMSDEYDNSKIEWITGFCCYTYQSISNLGILQICISSCKMEDSQIGDIAFSGHLQIKYEEQIYSILDFLTMFNLTASGKMRLIYCNSIKSKKNDHIAYLLAGETVSSDHINYKINSEIINEIAKNNISKYDFYECYASQKSLVYLLKDFSLKFIDNIENEALLLYICEVAMLQNAAISRINEQIIDELMQDSDISSRKTLKLQVEFGKTILLWDNMIYNYYMSQELSNDIVKAFGTDKLLEEYKRNSVHIEQIATLKSGIASNIEGKILNVLAFVLSISQLIDLIKTVVEYANGHPVEVGVSGGGIALLLVVLALIRRKIKM